MKREKYLDCEQKLVAMLSDEQDDIVKMATVVAVLHKKFDYFYWTGFYRNLNDELVVGPYQGTPACMRIAMGRGVCGTAALTRQTQVVENVEEFHGHIACDAASVSEIVVPVLSGQELIAVLDVDSTLEGSFDAVDAENLERILSKLF